MTSAAAIIKKGFFSYYCWGLNIISELECPELLGGTGSADVSVVMSSTPESLPDAEFRGVRYEMTQNKFLLRVDNVARYHVTNGDRIVVEPFPDAEPQAVRLFLLGSAFGALLQQRDLVPIHASVMEMGGRAVMFCGPSAMGKSTLAMTLYNRGYRMLADDVCVIKLDEAGFPLVIPGYPQFKLWADALNVLNAGAPATPTNARPGLEKYMLDARARFCSTVLPLKTIYFIGRTNSSSFELKPIRGKDKFIALFNNTYRIQFLEKLIDKSFHHRLCTAIAKSVNMVRLIRPDEPFQPDKLADLVEKDMLS